MKHTQHLSKGLVACAHSGKGSGSIYDREQCLAAAQAGRRAQSRDDCSNQH
jgi:hypothetical protein